MTVQAKLTGFLFLIVSISIGIQRSYSQTFGVVSSNTVLPTCDGRPLDSTFKKLVWYREGSTSDELLLKYVRDRSGRTLTKNTSPSDADFSRRLDVMTNGTGELTIKHTSLSDSGGFRCTIIRTGEMPIQRRYTLIVQAPPVNFGVDVLGRRLRRARCTNVNLGQTQTALQLNCSTRSIPAVQLFWMTTNRDVDTSAQMTCVNGSDLLEYCQRMASVNTANINSNVRVTCNQQYTSGRNNDTQTSKVCVVLVPRRPPVRITSATPNAGPNRPTARRPTPSGRRSQTVPHVQSSTTQPADNVAGSSSNEIRLHISMAVVGVLWSMYGHLSE